MSSFSSILSQSIVCIGAGIFFGAVYTRSRNIYSLIVAHSLYDIVIFSRTFTVDNNLAEFGSSGSFQDFDWINTIVLLIVYILPAVFLLRKKKMREIIDSEPNKLSLKPKYN